MKSVDEFSNVYLYRDTVDFRKSINGLGEIVEKQLQLNLFESSLFVFCCKRKKRIKILYWDKTGAAIWYKRLETDLFYWPRKNENTVIEISRQELKWLLSGIDLGRVKPHSEKKYQYFC